MARPLDYRSRERPRPREALEIALSTPDRPPWNFGTRGIALLVLLSLAGVYLELGSVALIVTYRLLFDGGACLVWLAGAIGWGCLVLQMAGFARPMGAALRVATAGALGLGMLSLVTLGLGLAGWLNPVMAWLMPALGIVGIPMAYKRSAGHAGGMPTAKAAAPPTRWTWLWLSAAPFLALAISAALVPAGMLWNPEEPNAYDVVEYHLQVPREWYEAHRIIPLSHNAYGYFPFNVEVHYLLAMHMLGGPWAGMYLAQFMHLSFMILAVVAVYGLARQFAGPASATIAGLCMLGVPWLTQIGSIAYDEGGFLLFGSLAIGFALPATFEQENRLRRFALAGAMGGLAAGSKLTAVPEVLVAVPLVCAAAGVWMTMKQRPHHGSTVVAWASRPCLPANSLKDMAETPMPPQTNDSRRRLWKGLLLFCVMGLLTFSPWMLRNLAWTHNPLFPELMPILGKAHFSQDQMLRWEIAHKAVPAEQPILARLGVFGREILCGWQFGYLLLPLALVAFGLSIRKPIAWCLLAMLLILAGFWLTMTHLQSRFFILATPIAALLVSQIDWRRFAIAGAAIVLIPALIGWNSIRSRFTEKLYGRYPIVSAVGVDNLAGLLLERVAPDGLPPDVTLVLVGDAKAYLYPVPMSRLRYKTVFDVKTDQPDLVSAWADCTVQTPKRWLAIDPGELRRLSRTYTHLPPLPAEVLGRNEMYVVKVNSEFRNPNSESIR